MQPAASECVAGCADVHLRAFLARLHSVDKGTRGGVPLLLRKVNLQNAKHASDVMRHNGPLRRHCGGGPLGKGSLHNIKQGGTVAEMGCVGSDPWV